MRRSRRAVTIGTLLLVAALGLSGSAGASRAKLPTPGTPSQVAALVAASSKIKKLPSDLVPALANVPYDNTASYYPVTKNGCSGTTECVFGETSSPTTVAMFGDSHAAMWLPALVYDAKRLDFRVILLWYPGCPAATVSVWNASSHSINKLCNSWRATSLKQIEKLDPWLVLLSNRTTEVKGADDKLIPNATWKAGMEETISELVAAKLHVALIGDITEMTNEMPECLAAHPTNIQNCSSPNPNPAFKNHFADEMAAAKAEDVPYLDPQSWLCTKTCSPVVGDFAVYYDSLHVSATYSEYLALDWESVVKPLLPTT